MNIKKGLFWHLHHQVLVEWCFDYDERAEYIRTEKPENERELRLRLFQPVKGELPQEVVKAEQAYDKAWQAYDKTWQAYYKKTWQALDKARRALNEALRKNMPAIEALHKVECPNCPWNGQTIFPRKG